MEAFQCDKSQSVHFTIVLSLFFSWMENEKRKFDIKVTFFLFIFTIFLEIDEIRNTELRYMLKIKYTLIFLNKSKNLYSLLRESPPKMVITNNQRRQTNHQHH